MKKKIFFGILILLIVIQFVRIDQTNPKVISSEEFFTVNAAPENIKQMARNACYDCHSNETKYPWYANVAPISWMLANHRNEGREHLNFSNWATRNTNQQQHALEECVEVIENGEMPMALYVVNHPEAKLSETQKKELVNYFKSLQK